MIARIVQTIYKRSSNATFELNWIKWEFLLFSHWVSVDGCSLANGSFAFFSNFSFALDKLKKIEWYASVRRDTNRKSIEMLIKVDAELSKNLETSQNQLVFDALIFNLQILCLPKIISTDWFWQASRYQCIWSSVWPPALISNKSR